MKNAPFKIYLADPYKGYSKWGTKNLKNLLKTIYLTDYIKKYLLF